MVDPHSNSLLVLYDDAQSIYEAGRQKNFSFKSVGIQAQGRTTILKVNYRNTQEILEFAAQFASELLKATDAEEDGIPRLAPISAGRHGKAPMVVKLPTLQAEGEWIAERLKEEHAKGTPWREMAILYRHYEPICTTVRKDCGREAFPTLGRTKSRLAKARTPSSCCHSTAAKVSSTRSSLSPARACCQCRTRQPKKTRACFTLR
jgi:superfamily I DNA/RNA helicase